MMSSDFRRSLEQMLDRLFAELDEGAVTTLVDRPIQAVTEAFDSRRFLPLSHRSFHAAIGGLVRRIHARAVKPPQALSANCALAEAIHLLGSTYGGGYDAAYLAALQPGPGGLPWVLSHLASVIIAARRRCHSEGVFARVLGPLDWETRCQLVQVLVMQNHLLLPAVLRRCRPGQLADQIPELIYALTGPDALLRQIVEGVPIRPA